MKKVLFGYVMIFSLLLTFCGCSEDVNPQQEPDAEFVKEPATEKSGADKKKSNNSGYQEEQDQDEQNPPEDEPPEIETEEIVPLELVNYNLISKNEINFAFSTAVNCVTCNITPHREKYYFNDGKNVKILLLENLELQTEFLIELTVKDKLENLLSVEVPLFVDNWVPKIEINELRTEFSGSRVEFIELKVKSAGELNGLQLYIMWNVKQPYIFDLPSVNVKAGEYVVYHLRTVDSGCVDELGEDLSESKGTDSSPSARDLWFSGSKEWLHKTDVVYLQDANGNILDAVVLNEKPGETWEKTLAHFAGIMEDLFNKGMWKSADGELPGPLDAVDTSTVKTSATKSISRYEGKENTHTSKDWYITDQWGATPGQPNK